MNYTKGEWKRSIAPPIGAFDIATYSEGLSTTIARVHAHPEGLANANLIASAPALYEALREIKDNWGGRDLQDDDKLTAKINQALAKAKGKE